MLNNSDENEREARPAEKRWRAALWRDRILGVCGFILALALFGVAWYAYPRLQRLTEADAQIKSVQTSVNGLTDRMRAAELRFDSQDNEQKDLHNQVANLARRVNGRIASARKDFEKSATQMLRQAEVRIDDHIRAIETRMARMESSSSEANGQVAELRRELGQVRGELAQQVRRDMRNDALNVQIANLKSGEERDRKDVNSILESLDLQRVAFEARTNQTTRLAAGVSLNITSTDIGHRRFSGWMWLMPDRRTLWLHAQNAQEPVTFYDNQDGKKRELIITNVTKHEVTGYLLLPKEGSSTEVANLRQSQ